MEMVGAFEAKGHLSSLLERVVRGEMFRYYVATDTIRTRR
jgi:hypothetical protein